jgi:hypothetical protein
MPEPSPCHPLRGYSPFRALALRLREQFQAEDAERAAALQAALARRAAARITGGSLAGPPLMAAARTATASRKRSRRLVH